MYVPNTIDDGFNITWCIINGSYNCTNKPLYWSNVHVSQWITYKYTRKYLLIMFVHVVIVYLVYELVYNTLTIHFQFACIDLCNVYGLCVA